MSGLYSQFSMTTNVSYVSGYNPANFFGTVFVTYSSKGCGGAGLFNSVFNVWLNGALHTMRSISMSHKGPYEDCASDPASCVVYDGGVRNVEPRLLEGGTPEGWTHPLQGTSTVEAHELVHLFGVSWHSSAKACGANYTDFRECAHKEYGNEFSLVGGAGAALELPAHERYHLHFLGADDVVAIDGPGSYAIAPIANAAAVQGDGEGEGEGEGGAVGSHRAALLRTPEYAAWLEYRRPLGYDTSLAWGDYEDNAAGLMVTVDNSLLDLRPDATNGDASHNLYQVTLNAGCSWSPLGSRLNVTNVVAAGNDGVRFDVVENEAVNEAGSGIVCSDA